MPDDLQTAIDLLQRTASTCVLCRGDHILRSDVRGLAPLLQWLDDGADTWACSAADKVVGKAAAQLYCLLGVRRVYGKVMSLSAMKLLRKNGIEAHWETLCESIRNRSVTGPCPLEQATFQIDEPEDALPIIRQTLAHLQKK